MEAFMMNKGQTDSLGLTDKSDANDVIIVNEVGFITKRRPILAMIPQDDGSIINEHSWCELNEKGEWIFKTERVFTWK